MRPAREQHGGGCVQRERKHDAHRVPEPECLAIAHVASASGKRSRGAPRPKAAGRPVSRAHVLAPMPVRKEDGAARRRSALHRWGPHWLARPRSHTRSARRVAISDSASGRYACWILFELSVMRSTTRAMRSMRNRCVHASKRPVICCDYFVCGWASSAPISYRSTIRAIVDLDKTCQVYFPRKINLTRSLFRAVRKIASSLRFSQ